LLRGGAEVVDCGLLEGYGLGGGEDYSGVLGAWLAVAVYTSSTFDYV
jgi:hypothetical protein